MQDFEPFHVQLRGKNAHPSRVTARSRHAGCKPAANNVVGHSYDRDYLSRALRRADIQVAKGDDEIDVLRDKLLSQGCRTLAAALRPSEPDANVASLFPADRFHVAPEGLSEGLSDVLRIGSQNADYWQAALLCVRSERPHCRSAAEKRNELAPPPVPPKPRRKLRLAKTIALWKEARAGFHRIWVRADFSRGACLVAQLRSARLRVLGCYRGRTR